MAPAHSVALAASCFAVHAAGASTEVSANPIRKVVTMLQSMQSKVAAEGEKAEELFAKFQCCLAGLRGSRGEPDRPRIRPEVVEHRRFPATPKMALDPIPEGSDP